MYDFYGGGRRRQAEAMGFSVEAYGGIEPPESFGEGTTAGQHMAGAYPVFDFDVLKPVGEQEPIVKWRSSDGYIIGQETLAEFAERTGYMPQSIHGGGVDWRNTLPTSVSEKIAFTPSYLMWNPDGSLLVMGTGNFANRDRVILSPEDMQLVARGLANTTGTDDDSPTDQGLSRTSVNMESAASTSGLSETQIRGITDGLGESERAFFLRRLANSEPISDTDIDFIFGRQSGGGYRYNASWEQFHRLDEQNLINRRRADLGSD